MGKYITCDQLADWSHTGSIDPTDPQCEALIDKIEFIFETFACEEIPTDPVPDKVTLGLLVWAELWYDSDPRYAGIASEQIGTYSYRIGSGQGLNDSTTVPPAVKGILSEWLCPSALVKPAIMMTTYAPSYSDAPGEDEDDSVGYIP